MNGDKSLYTFVRPQTEPDGTTWRVVETTNNRITAELCANELEPKTTRRISGNADFFVSLEEKTDE
ncbi:hypothetical protein [Nostoc sp. PA-18-2419]|uniref:hypothetical protein n=1 Tax=Nostoc sp. PA-18-2419 TaxID=2575443 RepID=UPI001107BA92|nr:hypothetical protein [Nostoc sp. PA-18-2419]